MNPISWIVSTSIAIPLVRHRTVDVRVIVHQEDTIAAKLGVSPRAREGKRDQREAEEAEEPAEYAAVFHGDLLSVSKVFMSV